MSDEVQRYRVTWPMVQAKYAAPVATNGAHRLGGETVMQGQLLPENIDPKQLQHLLGLGMVEPVEPAGPVDAEPAEAGAA